MWIDSHCHLDKSLRRGEAGEVLERMRAAGVDRCVTIGTSLADWDLYYQLASSRRGEVDFTVGLHPCELEDGWEDALAAIPTFFGTQPHPVALGEIGLDYFHLPKYPDEAAEVKGRQQAAFREQLALAFQFDCPVVIHSRHAVGDCVEMIDQSGVNWERVLFHCFTEGPEALQPILERGGRASFTGILTYKNASAEPILEAARRQGPERLVVETDSPYLTPEPVRGSVNEPANVAHVGRYAAQLFGMAAEDLGAMTSANARAFYGLD